MFIEISFPRSTPPQVVKALQERFPDVYQDCYDDEPFTYILGKSEDCRGAELREAKSFLCYTRAVFACGFCEGLIADCETMIEGNGGWAQSMLRRTDFSHYAFCDKEKRSRKRISKIFHRGKQAGMETRKKLGLPAIEN